MIQVGPFFTIDLDVDKMLVHELCGIGVFKAFPFHHMAPMTGSIADADQDGLAFLPGPL